jgi:hypothetical protein
MRAARGDEPSPPRFMVPMRTKKSKNLYFTRLSSIFYLPRSIFAPVELSPSFPIDGGTVAVCTAATGLQKPQCFRGFCDANFGKNRTLLRRGFRHRTSNNEHQPMNLPSPSFIWLRRGRLSFLHRKNSRKITKNSGLFRPAAAEAMARQAELTK